MKKKIWIVVVAVVIASFLLIYPTIEIQTADKLIAFRYSDDISEFEDDMTDNENYAYYAKKDISIHGYDFKKFLMFHVLIMEYVKGNMCEEEYVLEEEYIQNFIENAIIDYNDDNLDIAKLIEGKEAIVGNTRYSTEDLKKEIGYTLDGEYETMFVFYEDDLLVIQVGLSDEGPKFIAYKDIEN